MSTGTKSLCAVKIMRLIGRRADLFLHWLVRVPRERSKLFHPYVGCVCVIWSTVACFMRFVLDLPGLVWETDSFVCALNPFSSGLLSIQTPKTEDYNEFVTSSYPPSHTSGAPFFTSRCQESYRSVASLGWSMRRKCHPQSTPESKQNVYMTIHDLATHEHDV